jgi:hypothetical protein
LHSLHKLLAQSDRFAKNKIGIRFPLERSYESGNPGIPGGIFSVFTRVGGIVRGQAGSPTTPASSRHKPMTYFIPPPIPVTLLMAFLERALTEFPHVMNAMRFIALLGLVVFALKGYARIMGTTQE